MSAPGARPIIWANGEDQFCLSPVGHVLDLEDKCGVGLGAIFQRLGDGSWKVSDIRETIRLGLIGGGMTPERAMLAVKRHVDGNESGYAPSVLIAYEVIKAAIFGAPPDDPVGKEEPAEAKNPGSSTTTDASDDLKSSQSE